MTRSAEPIYEYACHEGNYAMGGILRGAPRAKKSKGRPAVSARADTRVRPYGRRP